MFAAAESIPFYLHAPAPTPGGHTAQGGPLVAGRVCWGSGVQAQLPGWGSGVCCRSRRSALSPLGTVTAWEQPLKNPLLSGLYGGSIFISELTGGGLSHS